ncbi:FtsX-like permease family protein [Kribbella sp. CA-293567]|uniref:FtsX-like permease family protein n=1 Tax=Kribbella sp. CA-293567 TaxID=3002436 RepID=UPI0022DD3A41|nr:FtsX-like permease family protein [Kribbella sp. CA-293567]WBQ03107.1 ABC transporter permease [Kribbella sp. CA-293567]
MFLRQALRYRWSQMLVLAGVSVLIGTCAAFAPWFSRAVEQTVTTETLDNQWLSAAWQLEGTPPPAVGGPATAPPPEELAQLVPADLQPLFSPPSLGMTVPVDWGPQGKKVNIQGRLLWRDGYCDRLVMTAGRCPGAANEIVLSTADLKNFGAGIGATLKANSSNYAGGGTLRVVGIYQADDADDYWYGRGPTGHSRQASETRPAVSDYLLTGRDTLAKGWGARSTLDTRPLAGRIRVDNLDRLRHVTDDADARAADLRLTASNTSGLVGLIDGIEVERRQAATIIPLVMVQVALFGVVVLALALAAVVDQRRPELAVSRLRGSGARRSGRALAGELAVPVLIGTLAGLLVGFGVMMIVRSTWLNGGAPLELPWTVLAAVALAAAVGLAVVAWSVRTVVRQPISTLLRRIAPRRRGRTVGLIDIVVIVVASAGLIGALTGGGRGPLPVLTPSLLALAVGLSFAHLLLPASGLISRRALRGGRLGLALGALQVARRPAVTRIVAVVAVATALVSFAGQASSVADRNRDYRAGYEIGAEGVLAMEVNTFRDFTSAVDRIDKDRNWLTPVVLSYPSNTGGLRALMIEPDSFRRIAFHGDQLTDDEGFGKLGAPTSPPAVQLRGKRLTIRATPGELAPYSRPTLDGEMIEPPPPARSVVLQATVFSLRTGSRYVVQFAPLKLVPGKPVEVSTEIDCAQSCELIRLGVVRELGDTAGLRGKVTIDNVSTETQPTVPLGRAADWQTTQRLGGDAAQGSIVAADGPPNGLVLDVTTMGAELNLQTSRIPAELPALVTPDHTVSEAQTVPGLDGIGIGIEKLDRLRSSVPRYTEHTSVVDQESVRRLGGSVADTSTDFEIWLNAEGLANSGEIIAGLAKSGISATVVDRRSERVGTYGRSASALALQLTPVIGVAGWALAIIVLLLMIVTSWRSRAQDYASLRITGVPASTTGHAARWEQTGPVALAALLGSACGVLGAYVALPMIPLFAPTSQPSPIPLDLAVNWPVALTLTLASTAIMAATTLLLGTGVNRRAGYARIREEL